MPSIALGKKCIEVPILIKFTAKDTKKLKNQNLSALMNRLPSRMKRWKSKTHELSAQNQQR